jgi:membrane protein
MLIRFLRSAWRIVKDALSGLGTNDPFRMAGATAFFTTFALPAILMIVVRTLGVFSDRRTVGRAIGAQLRKIFGSESMESILKTIRSFRALQYNFLLSVGIFLFLLFVATTLFKIIKNSINEIWSIRMAAHPSIGAMLRTRGVSVAVILLGGILFMSVQLVDMGRHMLSPYLMSSMKEATYYLWDVLSTVLILLVSTVWFYAVFRYLPDGRPSKKIALGGAVITAVLFNFGKLLIRLLLPPGRVNNFYGSSGALVLVLLFMFYSSLILYFGAAIIRAWSDASGRPIQPKGHAVRYRREPEPDQD